MRNGCCLWRGPLATYDLWAVAAHIVKYNRNVATRSVEMRFDDLERESCRDGGVESIAAFFKHRHADGRGNPMRGRDNTECSLDLGTGRKRIWIDLRYVGFHARAL